MATTTGDVVNQVVSVRLDFRTLTKLKRMAAADDRTLSATLRRELRKIAEREAGPDFKMRQANDDGD